MKNREDANAERIPMDDVVMVEEAVRCTHIEFCAEHYNELMGALIDRNLQGHLSSCAEEMVDKLEKGQPDAGLEATSAITSSAMQLFGPEAVVNVGGCPLCAFAGIVNHVADNLAVKYLRSN